MTEDKTLRKETQDIYVKTVNEMIVHNRIPTNDISDGYHTFGELYKHRNALFIALLREIESNEAYRKRLDKYVWKTQKYHDCTPIEDGWFILGIGQEAGKVITYHLPINLWNEAYFASTLNHAPQFDGHSPNDVLKRISKL